MAEPTLMKDGSIETFDDPNRLRISKPSFKNVKRNISNIAIQGGITLNKIRNVIPKPPEQLVQGLDWAYKSHQLGMADQAALKLGDKASQFLTDKGAHPAFGAGAALAIGFATPGMEGKVKGITNLNKFRKLAIKPKTARNINPFNQHAYATPGGTPNLKIGSSVNNPAKPLMIKGEGVVRRTPTSALIKEQLKDIDPRLAKRDVAKRYADNPEFIKKLSAINTKVQGWYDGPGKGRLAGFPKEGRVITAPDGIKYRIRDSNVQGGTGKFSINQDISARNTAQIRKIAQGPDLKTLTEQFKKHVPKNQVSSAVESYTKTNKKVYNALTAARKRYNVGKPKAEHATIEHIFDVDFHTRLKDEAVEGFSGQGADELWNLKMIDYALNSKTGALNKKAKDMGEVLIKAVQKDEFIDYNRVVEKFVKNDLGTKINKLTPKDWDIITEYSMKNPELNMQQILLNYTKGK